MKTILKAKSLWFMVVILLWIVAGISTTITIKRKRDELSISDNLSINNKMKNENLLVVEELRTGIATGIPLTRVEVTPTPLPSPSLDMEFDDNILKNNEKIFYNYKEVYGGTTRQS